MSQSSDPETKQTDQPAPAAAEPAPAPAPAPAEAAPDNAAAELAAARKESAASHERYLRAVADMENLRKRTLREKEELRLFAATNLVEDLIPILDNLGLGLAAARQQADAKSVAEGVAMVLEQFKGVLGRHGLKEVNPAGQAFDPNHHECIAHQPSAEVAAESVMQVVRPGYSLNGRLIRPASVIVSSGPAAPA